jgi:hypothetical protein
VAHLNGIHIEHPNQSNLNMLDVFRKSVDLINRNSTHPILVLYDTVLQRSGKHIQGSGWIYGHSEGKTARGMCAITAAISGSEGIFPLNSDIKPVRRKEEQHIMLKCFTIWGKTVFHEEHHNCHEEDRRGQDSGIPWHRGKKFFVTNMTGWKPKQIREMYLRRRDIETMHREIKQDGIGRIFQQVFAGIVSTTKLSLLGELLLEISAMILLGTQLNTGKGTPGLRFGSMAMRLLQDLFVALENMGSKLLDAIMDFIREPYASTIGILGG